VKILSPQQLRARLDERFRLLTGDRRDVLPRHQTLRALIDWSYDLLDERERALLQRLGVFVNGFTLDGAVAVGSENRNERDVLDALESLVDKSLVLAELDGDAVRYRMLESIRAYARDKLAAAGDLSSSLTRHLRHLRDLFQTAALRAESNGMSREIDTPLVNELEDVRVALDVRVGAAELEMGAELLAAIDARWGWIGLASEGSARIRRVLSLMPAGEARIRSRLWTAFSQVVRSADHVRALEAATTAVGLARAAKDPQSLAHALAAQAYSLARTGALEDAAVVLSEAEALAPSKNIGLGLKIVGLGLKNRQSQGLSGLLFGRTRGRRRRVRIACPGARYAGQPVRSEQRGDYACRDRTSAWSDQGSGKRARGSPSCPADRTRSQVAAGRAGESVRVSGST
jgi:hypothetical protein